MSACSRSARAGLSGRSPRRAGGARSSPSRSWRRWPPARPTCWHGSDMTNVHVRDGDGYAGWPEQAPFDAVIVTAAPDHVPEALVDQLAFGGRLVIPVGDADQDLRLRPHRDRPAGRGDCRSDSSPYAPSARAVKSSATRPRTCVFDSCPPARRCSPCLPPELARQVPTPEQFFGFRPGAEGELARYPKVLEYFQLIAKAHRPRQIRAGRQDDDGKRLCAAEISSPREPGALRPPGRDKPAARRSARAGRGRARRLAAEGRPFYCSPPPSTRRGGPVRSSDIVYRLATENSPRSRRSSTSRSCWWCRH